MYLEVNSVDLSGRYSYVTISGSARVCARTLRVGIVVSDEDPNLATPTLRPHAPVKWADDEGRTIFTGVVVTYQRDSATAILTVTAMDFGYYLANNMGYYSFRDTPPEDAVRQISTDWGFRLGKVADTGVVVSRKFPGVPLHNIINTLYVKAGEANGAKYHIRFEGDALCVLEKPSSANKILAPKVNVLTSSMTVDVTNYINTVEIRSNTGKVLQTIGGEDSQTGLLQKIITQADGEDATKEAASLLEAGQEQQIISIECLGDTELVTGSAVLVQETSAGVTGLFWIDADTHTWQGGKYTCKLELNFRNIMNDDSAGEEL